MPAIEFPRHHVALLQDLAGRVLDTRKTGGDDEALARQLLAGFVEACTRAGLDRVMALLEQAFPPADGDPFELSVHTQLRPALVERLRALELDGGGPRNAKPRLVADALVAALALTLVDEPDRTVMLADEVRAEVAAALASVIDVELAVPKIRDAVVADGRERCDPRYLGAFEKIAAQLDDSGMRIIRQPKLPLDAVQAVQHVLFEARRAVIERAARAAIDRAVPVLARANAEVAARIDQPITLRLTPRDVAITRTSDARTPRTSAAVVRSLLDSLSELSRIAWSPVERLVRAYAASQTFAVGDLIDHPKFGRGTVLSGMAARIEVEFADGNKVTLVHVRGPDKK